MAKIVKDAPGNAPRLDGTPGEYEWTGEGQAVDVDDVTAVHVLRIPGFSEVLDPKEVRKAEKATAAPVEVIEPGFTGPDAVTEPGFTGPAPAAE